MLSLLNDSDTEWTVTLDFHFRDMGDACKGVRHVGGSWVIIRGLRDSMSIKRCHVPILCDLLPVLECGVMLLCGLLRSYLM